MTQRLDQEIFGGGGSAEAARPKPPRRTFQSLTALLISLAVVIGGGYGVYRIAKPAIAKFTASEDYPGPGSGEADIVVNEGDSGRQIASTLVRADVIKTTSAFVKASSDSPRLAQAIQPGSYTLKEQMKAIDALKWLADPKHRTNPRVTVPEGLWASEIYKRLSKATEVPVKDYESAAKDVKALGLPAAAKGNVEGWLFPATYEFPPKATAEQQLKLMVAKAVEVMKGEKIDEADWEKTMILASIVESEAGSSNDRRKVARVFINRLEQPTAGTVGRLDSDATVSYGAKRRAVAPTEAERADASNPYNTKIHKGLPPGPISNPGRDSIDAVAHPADGPWFYFVTVNPSTGETKFAVTLEEQVKNSEEFVAWCKKHPEAKCFG